MVQDNGTSSGGVAIGFRIYNDRFIIISILLLLFSRYIIYYAPKYKYIIFIYLHLYNVYIIYLSVTIFSVCCSTQSISREAYRGPTIGLCIIITVYTRVEICIIITIPNDCSPRGETSFACYYAIRSELFRPKSTAHASGRET